MTGNYMITSSNQKYIKTVGAKSEEQITLLVMNESKEKDYAFDIILNKEGKSKQPLVIHADASLDGRVAGLIEKQTSIMFVFDTQGKLVKQVAYGLKHNLKNLPPEEKEII